MRKIFVQAALCLIFACVSLFPPSDMDAGGTVAGAMQERIVAPSIRDSQFEIEVLVGGRTLEEIAARGKRYVEAREGAEYQLRIRNPLPVRVAVALSVDGLNTIDARRTSGWNASKWVIEPYQTISIAGWQMSSGHARKFYFTSERDSYAARLGRRNDLGVISAVFYRESAPLPVPVTPPYPPYSRPELERRESRTNSTERSQADKSAAPSARANGVSRGATGVAAPGRDDEYAATGIGRSVENHVYRIQLPLERRPVAETTLRYEYTNALYKLGVLPRPRTGDEPLRRREGARGFEDSRFCPEPPQE